MRSLALMRRLGLFLQPRFVPEDICERLRRHLLDGRREAAEVYAAGQGRVDPDIRRTHEIEVPDTLRVDVQMRLDAVRSALSSHFGITLTASEGVSFLMYERGGFYRPHRDRAAHDVAGRANETCRRRVSVVVFLNRAAETPTAFEYAGGRLTLYGLVDEPAWREVGFPVEAGPGLLVAFDSNVLHEVTPVTSGCRMTAVDWFY